jgi:glycosyltransferase involved in cell wall biosynthesis
MSNSVKRAAFIVSHPIQYFAPLYQRLGRREDLEIKVFFTWHDGRTPVEDRGFKERISWDIPLTEGYEFELVPNVATNPGTHHFFGLRNPALVQRVVDWHPNVVLIHGWAWLSHLQAMHTFHKLKVLSLFRGDSHLIHAGFSGPRWWVKRALLRRIFSWPTGFLVVGSANRAYYENFGVKPNRLYRCPYSIDVSRFAEPSELLEQEAARWRMQMRIMPDQTVFLYAGKLEPKKRPLDLMRAVSRLQNSDAVLVIVGGGELIGDIESFAASDPARFRVLPFQNQTRMPVVYRLGDVFVLPSSSDETWGLSVNEALSCSRPVIVSDRVGCARDVVDPSCGWIFPWSDLQALEKTLQGTVANRHTLTHMRRAARQRAQLFDLTVTEAALLKTINAVST